MGFTREQNSWGGTNAHFLHDANAANGVPSRYEFTSDDRSLGATNVNTTHAVTQRMVRPLVTNSPLLTTASAAAAASAVAGSQEVAFSPPHLK